ncbi:disease resistance protein RGA2-like [Zingiber officinale]|uniref:Uncharacterized protein n=1 Tax=Zingiber officinale TaxID=94328 RepID=A0A8J5FUG0_ZINOF|nr:disease resistance protein RGA2-like [Zingiber officinale]KAG6495195.1 hypothetical protein ZIOFF_042987 [Zingiber officinale]
MESRSFLIIHQKEDFKESSPCKLLLLFSFSSKLLLTRATLTNFCILNSSGAMEAALVATARFVADKVTILVQLDEKLKAMTDIKKKMEKLKKLSTIIDMVIQGVESLRSTEDTVKVLLKELKYLAYDLEDVLDYYDTKVLQMQRSRSPFKRVRHSFPSNNQVVFRSRMVGVMIKASVKRVRDSFSFNQVVFKSWMGGKIKAVTDSLDSILSQKSILQNLPQDSIPMSELSLRMSEISLTHSRNSWDVKGRDEEKKMIIDMLTEDDDDESNDGTLKVIAIIGMGGLGKTTLAQLVYNDQRVQAYFASSTMWTVVGAEFNPVKIMKSVLEQATNASVSILEMDLVMRNLENLLSRKRFLLVLDDVWNEDPDEWGKLKAALKFGARGSKILVTTRSQQVSKIMDTSNTTHQIQQLSEDDCLSLFQQFAFGDEAPDQKLMKIGKKIVKKCRGVPLAAISLGSMLRGRYETYWSSVSKSEIWKLKNKEEEKLFAILKLSYNVLPLPSKKCFAFGSLFPKDFKMQKEKLIKLWIANGFASSEGNFEAETVGNCIFDDLVSRSFILLAPVQYDPDVTECMMHDLMHDLARSVSSDAYWNSYQDLVEVIGKRTYHLQVVEGKLPDMTQVLDKKPLYLRTFMALMPGYSSSLSINLLKVFSKLKYLRVLDLTGCGIREIPTSIENLIHLRYLNLYYNKIEVLPDSITLLPNLQYLNLGFNHELRRLPKKLGNMQNLRDLDLQNDFRLTKIPCGLSRLTNLRSLPVFIAGDGTDACSILELEDLKLCGEMQIRISHDFKNYSRSGRKILKNTDLNELHIEFHGSASYHKDMLDDLCPNTTLKKLEITNYDSPQFPTWMKELQLPNLVEVDLHGICGHIPQFRNLQFLTTLRFSMHGITHLGAEFHGSGGFPSLQELYLDDMNDLEEWSEFHGANELFPLLKTLCIINCLKLKSMPKLPTIQELEISCCNESLLSCIGRLTSLFILRVKEMDDMTCLPSGCIRNLTSLTELEIILCPQLQSLPGDEMQHLEMLQSLTIEGCDNLTSFPSEVGCLSSFCFLQLSCCPSVILQPEELVQILNSIDEFQIQICCNKVNLYGQLQHLHMLRRLSLSGAHDVSSRFTNQYGNPNLRICCCDELESLMTTEPANKTVLEAVYIDGISNLTALPNWLQHLKSLRHLSITNCSQLETLPSGLKDLHRLEDLRIFNCPQLKRRCEKELGEDWPIISHVSYVDIS